VVGRMGCRNFRSSTTTYARGAMARASTSTLPPRQFSLKDAAAL
jgi:hypothetical protein